MKKLLALVLAVLMVSVMGIAAFAAKGGFVYSPSVNPAPNIENKEFDHTDCPGEIVITPYNGRDKLDEKSAEQLEKAYDDILNVKDNEDLKKLLDGGLVSDLFNCDIEGCNYEGAHTYTVDLSSDTFKNFYSLLHYSDGKWSKVDGAKLNDNGFLHFTYDGTGSFAVVVKNSEVNSPETGNNGFIVFCIAMMIVSAVGFAGAFTAAKKRSAAHK